MPVLAATNQRKARNVVESSLLQKLAVAVAAASEALASAEQQHRPVSTVALQ